MRGEQHARTGTAVTLGLLILLTPIWTGCSGPTRSCPEPTGPPTYWSQPIYFQSVPFSFELDGPEEDEPEEDRLRLPGPEENAITLGKRRIEGRGGTFFIHEQRRNLERSSHVRVFRTIRDGRIWLMEDGDLTIEWPGNGELFAVEERNIRFGKRWYCHRGTIEVDLDGRITYRSYARDSAGKRHEVVRPFSAPATIQLDVLGNLKDRKEE